MILSERGALKAAVCDGGYHVYPAAKLIEYIKTRLPGEDFKGDFNPKGLVSKIRSVALEGDIHTKAILEEDLGKLCASLEKIEPNYNIEAIFEKMSVDLPAMAKRYFSIDGYKPAKTQVVEHFFEGYNDIYKDADWNAFNVDPTESKEYGVPIGIYFKRNQVNPAFPEYAVMHECVHQFIASLWTESNNHYYVPWIDEGFADSFGFVMLYRTTKNKLLISRTKNLGMEVDLLDSRKATYHYETSIALKFISSGGLPLSKAFQVVRVHYTTELDFAGIGRSVLMGHEPYDSIVENYIGRDKSKFEKDLLGKIEHFKQEGEFDDDDKMIFNYFSTTQHPATLIPSEYRACVWLMNELNRNPQNHYIHTKIFGGEGKLTKLTDEWHDRWKTIAKGSNSFLICKDDIPADLHEAVEKLGNYFFIVKKEYDGRTFFDVYGGGLPYRMATGELRCSI